jgi:hypothetical protein
LCTSLPHALFLGTPGELSQENGTCVRSGDGDGSRRQRVRDASTEAHERRGVGSGESSSGGGGCCCCLSALHSVVEARLVMIGSMEHVASQRQSRAVATVRDHASPGYYVGDGPGIV